MVSASKETVSFRVEIEVIAGRDSVRVTAGRLSVTS